MYTKIHHALVDGVSAMRRMRLALATDPDDHQVRVPWGRNGRRPSRGPGSLGFSPLAGLMQTTESIAEATVAALGQISCTTGPQRHHRAAVDAALRGFKTMLNVPIGGARRYAAQVWSMSRIMAVSRPPV